MASGLAALLDDIAAISRLAAASLDDVAGAAAKAGAKAAGVVVDDTAVTPAYVTGFTPERELPIVWKIAAGSLRNKFLFLLPGALALSAFASWLVTPLLMIGGAYLCFEATEKVIEAFSDDHATSTEALNTLAQSSAQVEKQKVDGAIRTDFILSAEIMAIALASVADRPLVIQAASLALVSLLLTVGVYGVVGLIVKMDDVGLHLAQRRSNAARALGRCIVKAMPPLLSGLSVVGTAAMLWVGGGILIHGLEHYHTPFVTGAVHGLAHWTGSVPLVGPFAAWLSFALASALIGFALGAAIVGVVHFIPKRRPAHDRHRS